MNSSLFLRLASGLTLLFAAGHASGAAQSWSPVGDTPTLQSMRTFRFDVMGDSRTYWDFYMGFGLYITILLLLQVVLLWQFAGMAREEPARMRPLLVACLVAWAAGTYVAWAFIFVVPATFSLAITMCLAVAVLTSRRSAS